MQEDIDPLETKEWLEALDSVLKHSGRGRTAFLLKRLAERAANSGTKMPPAITTPYRNSIAPGAEKRMPGDLFVERRIRSLIRWNALAMVMRANDNDEGLGGHISGTFHNELRLCLKLLLRGHEIAKSRIIHRHQEGHLGEAVQRQNKIA